MVSKQFKKFHNNDTKKFKKDLLKKLFNDETKKVPQ